MANAIFEHLRDGHGARVWDESSDVFKSQEQKNRFAAIQAMTSGVRKQTSTNVRIMNGASSCSDFTLDL